MHAIQVVDSDLVWQSVPAPTLAPRGLRIEVAATAVNRADLLQAQGHYPPPPGASSILGLECAGRIIDMGSEVEGFQRGARVMALLPGGGYAEEVVADLGSVIAAPADFADAEAGAFMETFLTAYLNIFLIGQAVQADWILVQGGGSGVGTSAIQLAQEAGLRVAVTAGSESRCRQCEELGADLAINYRDDDFVARVQDATLGQGVKVVLDCVGGAYVNRELECLSSEGTVVVIGLMGGRSAEIDLGRLLMKRLRVVGSTLRSRPDLEKAKIIRSFLNTFGEALAQGRLRPVVDTTFDLKAAGDAHARMAAGTHFGKIALVRKIVGEA